MRQLLFLCQNFVYFKKNAMYNKKMLSIRQKQ